MFLFLALSISSVQACYNYQCGNLTSNVCMSWVSTSITFNSNGCESPNYICSLSKAMIAYSFNPLNGTFLCERTTDFPTVQGYSYCGSRISSRINLKNGTFPKSCTVEGYSDSACMLQDGSNAECTCGFDSLLHCMPNPSSVKYDNYWKECANNDQIVTAEFFQYYQTLYNYYVENTTQLTCTSKLFMELGLISGNPPVSFARTLPVVIGILVSLL